MRLTDQTTWWAPTFKDNDTPSESMAIPWRCEEPPTGEEYRSALVDRIAELILANGKEARRALEVEFESICIMENREHWAIHIGMSPQMNFMLARIDWNARPGKFIFDAEENIPRLTDYVEGLGVE